MASNFNMGAQCLAGKARGGERTNRGMQRWCIVLMMLSPRSNSFPHRKKNHQRMQTLVYLYHFTLWFDSHELFCGYSTIRTPSHQRFTAFSLLFLLSCFSACCIWTLGLFLSLAGAVVVRVLTVERSERRLVLRRDAPVVRARPSCANEQCSYESQACQFTQPTTTAIMASAPFFVSVGVDPARPRDWRSLWSFFLFVSSRLCGILSVGWSMPRAG